jgi:dienelactone hydrolase
MEKLMIQPINKLLAMGFDEASFALVTGLKQLQKTPHYTTDRTRLNKLMAMSQASPNQLFPAPSLPDVKQYQQPLPWSLKLLSQSYEMKHLTFHSAKPLGLPNNDTAHAYYLYRPGYEQAPTLFYMHGWMAYSPTLWLRPPLSWAVPLGMNVFFLEQPFHMHRCPPGTQSGQMSLSGDLLMGLESIQQSVSDVRAGLLWLQAHGIKEVALLGRSLGGLVAATTLTVESGFSCAILDIPAVSPHSAIWRSNYTRLVRAELIQQGFDEQETAAFFEIIRPGRFQPALDHRRILLIEAIADRACFPDETERFAQEWNLTTVHINTGHLSVMLSRQAKRSAHDFLNYWLKSSLA